VIGAVHLLASGNINISNHVTRKIFGLDIELDVVWATLIAGVIVISLGILAARRATSGVPGKIQLFFETTVDQVNQLVESTVGPAGKRIVPLALALFLFILTANWLEVIPSSPRGGTEYLPSPTANVNLTYAMALIVIVIVHTASIRARGLRGYVKHYFQPFPFFFPINVIEEITKPITLTFRLFGNLFAGSLLILVVAVVGSQIAGTPVGVAATFITTLGWKTFGLFIGLIQALIFSLLTIMYLGMAASTEH
jgi:F-type H+-transporting ATPase subunit a